MAFLRAAQYSNLVGVYEKTWRQLAQTCWDEMAPATKVWENADKTKFGKAKPRFPDGCWNHGFVLDTVDPCDPLNRQKASWPACGIQNAVTNTQYLVCAARFSQVANAKTEYIWLWNWFYNPSLLDDQRLLASYKDVGQLVRERVSTFAEAPDKTYPPAPNYDKDRHWTGDQGILLGALLEMVRLDPNRRADYYPLAKAILDAVRTKLVNGRQILQPWTPPKTIGSIYLTDYATGVGVFMRYLLYVYDSGDEVLRPYIASQEYWGFIKDNADAVCDSIGKCPPLPNGSQMDHMECLLNQLAVLNAAIVILAH